jgi:hypothetical protein
MRKVAIEPSCQYSILRSAFLISSTKDPFPGFRSVIEIVLAQKVHPLGFAFHRILKLAEPESFAVKLISFAFFT